MSSTTSGLSNLMPVFYDRKFLDRAKLMLRYDVGAQLRTMPTNSGKTVYFNRFSPLPVVTTALTEAAVPTAVDMTSNIVSATIAEYGTYTKVSSLFNFTSIDEGLLEHVSVMGQNAGETLDTLIAAELSANATVQFAGAKSALSSIATSDVLSGAEVRKAVKTLKVNKAMPFEDGLFRGIVSVNCVYDLRANSEWLAAYQYVNPTNIQNGEVGSLHGVRFFETNNVVSESSTTTVYSNFIFGKNAYGILNLEGQPGSRIYVKNPTDSDTSNPINTWSTVGWKAFFVAKTLNSNWIINIKAGSQG